MTLSGVLQPLADGVKLLRKQNLRNKARQVALFILSPILLFGLFLLIWGWVLP